jgi:hypothetical protein
LATALVLSLAELWATGFQVTSIIVTNNNVRLTWDAPGGSNYVVQSVTNLKSNFIDLSQMIYVPGVGVQSASYTHTNGLLNSSSRFYRVRSLTVQPLLQIQPTNVVMAPGMINRYKVVAIYPDNSAVDVTTSATLTSLNTAVAQVVGPTTNGFLLVSAVTNGTCSLRAVYQSGSNTVNLTVGQLTGIYTVPALSSISNYVGAPNPPVQVFGVFTSGQTNNITPASNLDGAVEGGGPGSATRVDYAVAANVANSYALITGQSAADGQTVQFDAGGVLAPQITVQWCSYLSVSLVPNSAQISVGATQQFSVFGNKADGTIESVPQFTVNSFLSSDGTIAQADRSTLRVAGLAPGTVTVAAVVNNLVNCGTLADIATVTVGTPPAITNQPADQTVNIGSNSTFNVMAVGSVPLAYQWQFYGTNAAGATLNSLTVSNADSGRQGPYRVIVTNAYGSVTSSVAMLAVAPAAVPLWTNRYIGPGNTHDQTEALAVDNSGNVFVTGHSYSTNTSYDYATIKYSNAGVPLWTNRYNGPGNDFDSGRAIAIDPSSNVFVTGVSPGLASSQDFATIKYSNVGVPLWTNRYNGTANGNDFPYGMAIDTSGNVVVTGLSDGGSSYDDYATIKYSNAGVALWTNRYDGPNNTLDVPFAVAVDTNGNVFVTGYSYGVGTFDDYATIKYSNAGVPLWTNRYDGPGHSSDDAVGIALDGSGNVFVTGYSSASASVSVLDYATIKYSNAGVPLWTNRYNGPGNGQAFASAIAVDRGSNVVVTGYSPGLNGDNDYATIKYSNAGVPVWTNRYNGPANSSDTAGAIAVDKTGNVIVTGSSANGSGDYDIVTIKYSSAGTILWLARYSHCQPSAVAVDSNGNVFVAGQDTGSTPHYVILKYAP